jgi:dihydroflavonol-4-reductase
VEFVVGDILDVASVREAIQDCDACIHSAAFTTLDPEEMGKCLEVNGPGTRIVLDAAVEAACDPIIHVSSMSCIFPPVGDLADPDVDPVHSSDAPYSRSKAEAENYARELQARGHPVAILYPSGVTGPDDLGLNVMAGMLTVVLGAPFVMAADTGGYAVIDVRDLAAATVGLLTSGVGPKRYMAMGQVLDWASYNAVLAEVTGRDRDTFPMAREELLENLDEEAVDIMLGIKAGNDAPLLQATGVQWRAVPDTLEDTIRWLLTSGALDPEWAPALAR